jgi:HEAT repeat protein
MGILNLMKKHNEKKKLIKKINILINDINNDNSKIRIKAIEELKKIGDPAVKYLIPVLKYNYGGARGAAAMALGEIGNPKAFKPLCKLLKDNNESVKALAVGALGKLNDKRAIKYLIPCLKEDYKGIRFNAVMSLLNLAGETAFDHFIEALKDEDSQVRFAAVGALGKIGDNRAVEALLDVLANEKESGDVFLSAVVILGSIGDVRVIPALLQIIQLPDAYYRSAAASALGNLGIEDDEAIRSLIGLLEDEDSMVRRCAVTALGQIGKRNAIKPLRELVNDQDQKVKAAAKESLEKLMEAYDDVDESKNEQNDEIERSEDKDMEDEPIFEEKFQKGKNTYEVYTVNGAEPARKFLLTKNVDKPLYYITIKTTQGIWGLDKEGLYLVKLLPWQIDLEKSECEGSIQEKPTRFSVTLAANGNSDNFICKIKCGNCEYNWFDGIRYQNHTIVRCPKCKKYNKVDSRHIIVNLKKNIE